MPQLIKFHDNIVRAVATEEELLEFVNNFREATGQEILESLLPSTIGDVNSCLIATAVNLDGEVNCHGDGYIEPWTLTYFTDHEDEQNLIVSGARTLGLEFYVGFGFIEIELPREIGYAALAFDEGIAFQEYVN